MKAKSTRLTMTVPEVAKVLGIGKNQAYEAVRRGDIPCIRIGKRILVPTRALERLLQACDCCQARPWQSVVARTYCPYTSYELWRC